MNTDSAATTSPVPRLLALDWGTTSLRAYLLAGPQQLTDSRESAQGIMNVANRDFGAVLDALCGDWLQAYPSLPVIASGMIGSAQGWVEVPYVHGGVTAQDLVGGIRYAEGPRGRAVAIIPGVMTQGSLPNVMRGEETQVFGAAALQPETFAAPAGRLVVLPGTHSKWVLVEAGRIASFSTFMTGELFAVLRQHSILGRLMQPNDTFEADAFQRGLQEARDDVQGGLLSTLFSVRTLGLTKRLQPTQLSDYLSGLLIGYELRGAVQAYAAQADLAHAPLVLIGAGPLCERYRLALPHFGLHASADLFNGATQAGLWEVASRANFIPSSPEHLA